MGKQKQGAKGSKAGRNKRKCDAYRMSSRLEKAQARRRIRHALLYENDVEALDKLLSMPLTQFDRKQRGIVDGLRSERSRRFDFANRAAEERALGRESAIAKWGGITPRTREERGIAKHATN